MYLFASICLVICFLVGWLCRPSWRMSSLLSASVLAPFAFLGAAFVPVYWRPDHCFTIIRGVGIEDILFCFACGGIAWLTATIGTLPGCERVKFARFFTRFASWVVLALSAVFVVWSAGCAILVAVILGFTSSGLFAIVQEPGLRRLIIPGALGFTAVYAVVGWVVIAVHPQSAGFWVGDAISGTRVMGLPVEEMIWAVSFGATWPVVFGYCLGGPEIDRVGSGGSISPTVRRMPGSSPGYDR